MSKLEFLVLVMVLMSSTVQSMRFDLKSGQVKCISEDIMSNAMTVGKYSVVNPNEGFHIPDSHKLSVTVTSQHGNKYHEADGVESGTFAFTAVEAGDYSACFSTKNHHPPVTVTVDLEWKSGVAARDWSKVAKKGSVEAMEIELKRLYDTVTSIHDQLFYLREREEQMQELNRATTSKMATLGFLSLIICLSVVGLQFWHLKTFFERKKLL